MNSEGAFYALVLLALVLLFGIGLSVDAASCRKQWQDSGMDARWLLIGGCQISADGRHWIPAENYREFEQ